MIRLLPLLACIALAGASESLAPLGKIADRLADPALVECSGVVASRAHPGALWAHNDSGNAAELFAIGADGITVARYAVAAPNIDWEDIAIGDGGIYLADVGNNRRDRPEVQVLRIDEPDPRVPPAAALPVRTTYRLTKRATVRRTANRWIARPSSSPAPSATSSTSASMRRPACGDSRSIRAMRRCWSASPPCPSASQ